MRQVWKFPLELKDHQLVHITDGWEAVLVAERHGHLYMWAEVDTGNPELDDNIYIRGTGHTIEEHLRHVGSAQVGQFVWHVYTD